MTSTDAGRQTMPVAAGPKYRTRQPRMNHVAMSLAPDNLDERHRKERADFYGDVFAYQDNSQLLCQQLQVTLNLCLSALQSTLPLRNDALTLI
jgi:hypothetical protein